MNPRRDLAHALLAADWPESWEMHRDVLRAIAAGAPVAGLEGQADELAREVGRGHLLWSRTEGAVAIAASRADDDVVFLIAGDPPLALVHLTWRGGREPPPWPHTRLFADVRRLMDEIATIG